LKSERGGFDNDAKRLAQANIVRQSIIKLLNDGRKVIVIGDLNSEEKNASLYRIRGFDDVYEELIQTCNSDYFDNTDVR
jgi:endonuclease/exonuclease/phosphatase family metal-dependent hydrolase